MDKPEALEEYTKITTWHVAQYAYFLENLKKIKEGDKTLLDNSMIMFTSDLRDGNRHSPRNLPIVLAGERRREVKAGSKHQLMKRRRHWRTYTLPC